MDELGTITKLLKFIEFVKAELIKIDERGNSCEYGWYGGDASDEDVRWAFSYFQEGKYDDAAWSLLQNYCDQDGGEHRNIEFETEDLAAELGIFAKAIEGDFILCQS